MFPRKLTRDKCEPEKFDSFKLTSVNETFQSCDLVKLAFDKSEHKKTTFDKVDSEKEAFSKFTPSKHTSDKLELVKSTSTKSASEKQMLFRMDVDLVGTSELPRI